MTFISDRPSNAIKPESVERIYWTMVSGATFPFRREELAELDEQFRGPIRRVLPIFSRTAARTTADVARFRIEAHRDFGFDDD